MLWFPPQVVTSSARHGKEGARQSTKEGVVQRERDERKDVMTNSCITTWDNIRFRDGRKDITINFWTASLNSIEKRVAKIVFISIV